MLPKRKMLTVRDWNPRWSRGPHKLLLNEGHVEKGAYISGCSDSVALGFWGALLHFLFSRPPASPITLPLSLMSPPESQLCAGQLATGQKHSHHLEPGITPGHGCWVHCFGICGTERRHLAQPRGLNSRGEDRLLASGTGWGGKK